MCQQEETVVKLEGNAREFSHYHALTASPNLLLISPIIFGYSDSSNCRCILQMIASSSFVTCLLLIIELFMFKQVLVFSS